MKIEFRKISANPKQIDIKLKENEREYLFEGEGVVVKGELNRLNSILDSKLVKFQGGFCANLELICARSGEAFFKEIDYNLTLYFSDGICEMQSQIKGIDPLDIIEFFDGFIDFDFIIQSEIESIRLDYNVKD